MKVGIVVLGFDGPDRVAGTILCLKEFQDAEWPWFGARVRPPRFHIIVLDKTRLADLPLGFRQHAGHKSRKRLNYTKLPNGMAEQLRTKNWVGLDPLAFRLACDDMGDYWDDMSEYEACLAK